MKTQNVVILGGGYAGVNAALRLRLRSKEARITVINERDDFIERIRNHEAVAGHKLRVLPLKEVLGKGIEFLKARVERIDTHAGQLSLISSASKMALSYDVLVYAVGSGAQAQIASGMHNINTREDAELFRSELEQHKGSGVVIVGAGLTGLELATELREKYPDQEILLADRKLPGNRLSAKGQNYLAKTLVEMRVGFEKVTNDPFADNTCLERWKAANMLVVNCTGFGFPDLGKRSGLRCDERNRVLVNEHLQADGHENIFVAGDAGAYAFGTEEIAYAGCATAMPMGTFVGDAIAKMLRGESLPTFHYGFTFQCISLGRKNGIIQFLDKKTGVANSSVLTGKSAAIFKELICKMTITLPRWERKTRWPFYTWRKTRLLKRIGQMASKAA